jgi:hypothetical protein
MIRYSDIPHMTVRELCELAEQIRKAPAATYLQESAEPEPPPTPTNVIEFPGPRLVN